MSQSEPECLIDGTKASDGVSLHLISGAYLCAEHAKCTLCKVPFLELITEPIFCGCADYGYSGHEYYGYCGDECYQADHSGSEDIKEDV